jgi:hypothetical protein
MKFDNDFLNGFPSTVQGFLIRNHRFENIGNFNVILVQCLALRFMSMESIHACEGPNQDPEIVCVKIAGNDVVGTPELVNRSSSNHFAHSGPNIQLTAKPCNKTCEQSCEPPRPMNYEITSFVY